jgi:hypothetical protein
MVGILGVGVYGGSVLATPASGQTTTPIATKISFDPIDVKAHADPASLWGVQLKTRGLTDAYVVDNKFAPVNQATGAVASTGWHFHPGPSFIMVIAGTVTDYEADDPTCTGHSYSAGQGFMDSGEGAHILRNEGNVAAETIAMQLVPKDAPRRIDLPQAPGNCPF